MCSASAIPGNGDEFSRPGSQGILFLTVQCVVDLVTKQWVSVLRHDAWKVEGVEVSLFQFRKAQDTTQPVGRQAHLEGLFLPVDLGRSVVSMVFVSVPGDLEAVEALFLHGPGKSEGKPSARSFTS